MSFIKDLFTNIEQQILNKVPGTILDEITSKSAVSDIQPGDVEIVSITLLSEDQQRKYNLMSQCKGFDIYESIMSPVIFAELSIADSIGLVQSFPIIGEEYVSISFRTPKAPGQAATYLFRVNRVVDKLVSENNKMVTYRIQLVSAELMRNAQKLVTKNYKQEISGLVKEILSDELGTQKPITVDKTIGIEQGNITRMQPLKAIDYFRQRAVSGEYKSQSWVFFESRKGFNFTTIEKLIDVGNKQQDRGSNKEFFFDASRKEDIRNVTMRNILAYNQLSFGDSVSKIQHGGLFNEVSKFDIVTGGITKTTYKDLGSDTQFKMLDGAKGKPSNSAGFKKSHGTTPAVTKFIPVTADRPPTYIAEKLNVLGPYTLKMSQNITQVMVYGDSDINIGDVVKCSFPSAVSADNDKGVSRLDSGSYLVAKIRHMVLNGDRPQHGMVLELIKGNFAETA